MSIEGLQAILDKEEIVATQRAEMFIDHPALVDDTYRRHVRTYVPFGRRSSGGDGQSVAEFEKEVIREVKARGAVRGYITAEYGHGKTSTALYLWQQARDANLLVVPPFQLNKLTDLIQATYGWARHEIGRTRPGSPALAEAEALYRGLIERNAAAYARRYAIAEETARQMIRDKPDILELTPADYIAFFEGMTALAHHAGYDGLLVLADELQQYIDPEVKAGIKDPVTPFFDVISNILTRRNHLAFGLIVIIPPRELEVLRDQRGDFIHRLLQVSLDLRTVYDQEFPGRLWANLAREHDFADHRDRVLSIECLRALGQIGARADLSDGPRTVINTFRRATRLYAERGYPHDRPYSPEALVDDLLAGNIRYDSSKRIAQVAARVLDHSLVKGQPARERAVKWAAAFPNEGVPRDMQERFGLVEAFDELTQSAHGDLVLSIGDIRNKGITLAGLEARQVKTDWLSGTMREFWRNYVETAEKTQARAMGGFLALLKSKVFPDNQWKVLREMSSRFTQNAGLVLQGAFTAGRQRFPERTVHVRVLWEDEPVKDAGPQGEVLVEIRLRRYLDKTEGERRVLEEPLRIDHDGRAMYLTLNLMGRAVELSSELEANLGPIVSPYKLTPLLLLNLYQVIDEHRAGAGIPKEEDQAIRYGFQPALQDNAFRQMFNETVGRPVGAGQERVIELALFNLFDTLYRDYRPLTIVANWTSSLQKYENALGLLESNYERQGQSDVEGTKDEIAKLFTLTNTGLDSFARNFPTLIDGVSKLPGKGRGVARFTLHPLERSILHWLSESERRDHVHVGNQSHTVRVLPRLEVYDRSRRLGYLESEIDALLSLMSARGLIEEDTRRGLLREAITLAPSVDELEREIDACLRDITTLQEGLGADPQLRQWAEAATKTRQYLNDQLRKKPDDNQLYQRKKGVGVLRGQLDNFAAGKQTTLREEAARQARGLAPFDARVRAALSSPVQGSVEYVSQINDQLRAGLLRSAVKLEDDIATLQKGITATQSALAVTGLTIGELVDAAKAVRGQHAALEQMRRRQDAFTRQHREYAEWVNLITDGNRLSDELNQLGELVNEPRQAFDQLSRDIKGHLSAGKLDALPDAPGFSLQLSRLADIVRAVRLDATGKFTQLQERYREAIGHAIPSYPRDQLWQPNQFNPLAPHDSYVHLRADVAATIRDKVMPKFQDSLKRQSGSIRDTLQSPLLKSLPADRQADVRRRAEHLHRQLNDLQQALKTAHLLAQDDAVFADFPDTGGQLRELLNHLAGVLSGLTTLDPQVKELGSELQKMELTRTEDALLANLANSSGLVDLGTVRQAVAGMDEGEFWRALSGLQAKRRVRISIERIIHD